MKTRQELHDSAEMWAERARRRNGEVEQLRAQNERMRVLIQNLSNIAENEALEFRALMKIRVAIQEWRARG